MEMAIGGEAAAAGKAGGATASGEYWSEALKSFLDHIPVSSVSGAVQSSSSPALELNLDGCVLDAIGSMYRSNVGGAVIVDEVHSSLGKFVDRDIGFVDFPSLVLWALEELDKVCTEREDKCSDFLSSLKCHPQIDCLRLNVIPVVESVNSSVYGFVTQNTVIELLLQSSGLEWLDKIADKQLSEFRFVNASKPVSVYSDQSVAHTLHALSKQKTGVAVVDRKTGCLTGMIQCSDVYLLLDDSSLFSNIRPLSAEEFVKLKNKNDEGSTEHSSAPESQSILSLRSRAQQRAGLSVTNRNSGHPETSNGESSCFRKQLQLHRRRARARGRSRDDKRHHLRLLPTVHGLSRIDGAPSSPGPMCNPCIAIRAHTYSCRSTTRSPYPHAAHFRSPPRRARGCRSPGSSSAGTDQFRSCLCVITAV